MTICKNLPLSAAEVELAVREYARQKAAKAGEPVPDALDFTLAGRLHYRGPNGEVLAAAPFTDVVVIW